MKKSMRVGIDFGSTYSTISEYNSESDQPEPLLLDTAAPPSIPSVVCIDTDEAEGSELVGVSAKDVIGNEFYSVFEAFKMLLIEKNEDILLKNGYTSEYTPKKITTLFLKNVLTGIKSRHMDSDGVFECIYICVPEIWCSETRKLEALDGKAILRDILMNDVRSDDLPILDVQVVTEPEAASAFFARNYEKETNQIFNGHLLLIDYGGGTLDLTLTEVMSKGDGMMDIAYRGGGGAGENHRDENGAVKVGDAGLAYMREVLCCAIADSGYFEADHRPEYSDTDFRVAFKHLETALKDSKKRNDIEQLFRSYGGYKKLKKIFKDDPINFHSVPYKRKKINITYQHLYKVYSKIIEPVLGSELEKINMRIKELIDIDPCIAESGNNDNFKIALVGGFGSFYLVNKQIAEIYSLTPDEGEDKRIKNIATDKRELAISLGASLLAAEKVKLQKTARYSIGIVSRMYGGQYVLRYGIRCHQNLDINKPYFLLRDYSKPDVPENRQSYSGTIRNNMDHFAIEDTDNMDHGKILAIKPELQERFNMIPDVLGPWNIGFSVDKYDVITMHFIDTSGENEPVRIPLERLVNLFALSDDQEIERINGVWKFSEEKK